MCDVIAPDAATRPLAPASMTRVLASSDGWRRPSVRTLIRYAALFLVLIPSVKHVTAGDLEREEGGYYAVTASRNSLAAAVPLARGLRGKGEVPMIMTTASGVYDVIVYYSGNPDDFAAARSKRNLPKSSVLTRGEDFVSVAWPVCSDCYGEAVLGKMFGKDGLVKTLKGFAIFGDSYDEARSKGIANCKAEGYDECVFLDRNGAWDGGCVFVSIGESSTDYTWASADTRHDAYKKCLDSLAGSVCKEAIGDCTKDFPR